MPPRNKRKTITVEPTPVVETEPSPEAPAVDVVDESVVGDEESVVAEPVVAKTKKQRTKKTVDDTKKKKQQKKRGPSSYILFTKDYRTDHPDMIANMSLSEMSKKCGEAWKALSDAEKEVYRKKAEDIRVELRSHDPPPPPKKPMSSYLAFAMEKRKEIVKVDPTLKLGEISKKCGELWKQLSDEERVVWKNKAASAIPVS